MNGPSKALAEMETRATAFDFETAFHAHYPRIARVIARVIRDPGRAEELAVEVMWKFWRTWRVGGRMALPHSGSNGLK